MTRDTLSSRLDEFMKSLVHSRDERVRQLIYLTGTFLFILLMTLHLCGAIGLSVLPLQLFSAAILVTTIVSAVFYFCRRITLVQAYRIQVLLTQGLESARIVALVLLRPEGYGDQVMSNLIISYTLLLYLTLAFLTRLSFVVAWANILTLVFVVWYDFTAVHISHIVIFFLLYIFTGVLIVISHHGLRALQAENDDFQITQSRLQSVFNMTPDEFKAYLQLSHSGNIAGDAGSFLQQLDETSRRNLVRAVLSQVGEEEASRHDLATRFPQLTEAELEVCRLVLEGKSLRDISRVTGKTANNISTVRGNVRKKLGLPSGVDLKDFLAGG